MKRFLGTALGACLFLVVMGSSAQAQAPWSYAKATQGAGFTSVLGIGGVGQTACVQDSGGGVNATLGNMFGSYVNAQTTLPIPSCVVRLQAVTGTCAAPTTVGSQAFVAVAGCIVPPAAPAAPSGLTATVLSPTMVKLNWFDNSATEDGFRIDRCQLAPVNDCAGLTTPNQQIGTVAANSTMFTDNSADANATNRYRVCSFNLGGEMCSGNVDAVTGGAPNAVIGQFATGISLSEIEVTWTPAAAGTAATGFRIEFCQMSAPNDCAGGTLPNQVAGSVGAGVTMFTHTGLKPNTTYTYQVIPFNTAGDAPAAGQDNGTTFAVPPPTGLVANATSPSTVDLQFTDPDPSMLFDFNIYQCAGAACAPVDNFQLEVAASGDVNVFATVTGLASGTVHRFQVKTLYMNVYESVGSNIANAATPPGDMISPANTGQFTCYDAAGNTILCSDPDALGEDGEVMAGAMPPSPRFLFPSAACDPSGTADVFEDLFTGYCYMFDMCSCAGGPAAWYTQVHTNVATGVVCDPTDPTCAASVGGGCAELTGDGSAPGDWVVASINQAMTLIDWGNAGDPTGPNTPGLPTELVTLLGGPPPGGAVPLACWDAAAGLWTSTTAFAGDPAGPHADAIQVNWATGFPVIIGPLPKASVLDGVWVK